MTPKGAQHVIESMSLRVFEIEESEQRLAAEKRHLQQRISELEHVRDRVEPFRIVMVGL